MTTLYFLYIKIDNFFEFITFHIQYFIYFTFIAFHILPFSNLFKILFIKKSLNSIHITFDKIPKFRRKVLTHDNLRKIPTWKIIRIHFLFIFVLFFLSINFTYYISTDLNFTKILQLILLTLCIKIYTSRLLCHIHVLIFHKQINEEKLKLLSSHINSVT